MPAPGDRLVYSHPDGLGFGEDVKAKAGFGEITAEMKELDLKNGQEVEFFDYDADSGWPIIKWVDGVMIDRLTTIEPDIFDVNFIPR
jgi:hypothetical protein